MTNEPPMRNYLLFILVSFSTGLWAQYQGPIAPISSGYGAKGPNAVEVINLPNDRFPQKDISVFYPQGTTSPVPTIFFSHGYGGNDTVRYIETLRHLASRGYVAVFVPYSTIGITIPERYLTLFEGFTKAARTLPTIIDTTRVGFYGHSFGGGATPRVAYRAFRENNWGVNGKFIFCSAPWYSFELGTTNLPNFPTDCNMLTVLYDDDFTNDHRMGMDIFNNIVINDSIKDCLMVFSDTISGYLYEANHNLPGETGNGELDALDYYVTFRLLDALSDYTFTGDLAAKEVALGNGSAAQIDMGGQLSPLNSIKVPSPVYAQSLYQFQCNATLNERQAFCPTALSIDQQLADELDVQVFPNPTDGTLTIATKNDFREMEVVIHTMMRQKIFTQHDPNTLIDIRNLPVGTYTIRITLDERIYTQRIVKE
ncbi:MAG: T9SS type A sorting domain-containing protein [Bacteroidota bacterium]